MRFLRVLLAFSALVALVFVVMPRHANHELDEAGPYPSDWFDMQRAFPRGEIPQEAYQAALQQAMVERAAPSGRLSTNGVLDWQFCGPTNIGGRVTALAVSAGGATVYLVSANGGVFKSTNSGTN